MEEFSAFLIVSVEEKETVNTRRARKSGELEERAEVLQPMRYPTKFLSPNANRPGRNFEVIKKLGELDLP